VGGVRLLFFGNSGEDEPANERLLWVISRHFTSDFPTGRYEM